MSPTSKALIWASTLLSTAASIPKLYQYVNHSEFDPCSYAAEDVLVRDVVVIAGGASGTYGAIALKDQGRSVAVVEKEAHFGGHVNTYDDPETGLPLEYGVEGYFNDSTTYEFFSRFEIPLALMEFGNTTFVDFRTGQKVQTASSQTALINYILKANEYYPDPAIGIQLSSPVPRDVLMPFGDFLKANNLSDAAYSIWAYSSPDNNLMDQLTLYGFVGCNSASSALLGGGGSDVAPRNNSELFGKAEQELGDSALLSSTVVAGRRDNNSVALVVQTPTTKKLILASQVLMSAPIILENMQPFGLDEREHNIFSKIYYTAYYTALVKDTGLEPGSIFENAGSDTEFNIPIQPYTFRIGASRRKDAFYAFYGTTHDAPEAEVKATIARDIMTLSNSTTPPTFLAFASHTPFKQQVSREEVAAGFWGEMNTLQGYRNMHYTGNALDASGSSSLFNFTKLLLPAINEAIDAYPAPELCACEKNY